MKVRVETLDCSNVDTVELTADVEKVSIEDECLVIFGEAYYGEWIRQVNRSDIR
jgi:hypothetical protein